MFDEVLRSSSDSQAEVGESNPDIFYTDKSGHRNRECLSLGCDLLPIFADRTPIAIYRDFVQAFADCFNHLFGAFCHLHYTSSGQVRSGLGEFSTLMNISASHCQIRR